MMARLGRVLLGLLLVLGACGEGDDSQVAADTAQASPDVTEPSPDWWPPGVAVVGECGEGDSDCTFTVDDDAEVLDALQRIYQGASMYYRTAYMNDAGYVLPNQFPTDQAATPLEGTCCSSGGMGGPDVDGNDLCDRVTEIWNTDTWSAVAFNIHGKHYDKGCGTYYGPDSCDANQHAYVYSFEAEGILHDSEMTASAATHVGCDPCREARVSVVSRLDPDATWTATPNSDTCTTGCLLLPPEHLDITIPTRCDTDAISGQITLTDAQREGFLLPDGTASLHPWWDELNAATNAIIEGAVAAYEASDPAACSFPPSQGVTPLEGTCCSSSGLPGPDTDGDDRCDHSPATWDTETWIALDFAPSEPHGFVYETESSGEGLDALFTVTAYADMDCDGIQSTFRRMLFAGHAATGWDSGVASLQDGTCTPVGGDDAWVYPTRAIYYTDKQAE